jgi:uncharacterized protein YcfJ
MYCLHLQFTSTFKAEAIHSSEILVTTYRTIQHHSCLGGIVVNVLATGPKGHGFKHGRGNGFLRAIKICSTPSFGWEVKSEVPCPKILWHVKDPLRYFRY